MSEYKTTIEGRLWSMIKTAEFAIEVADTWNSHPMTGKNLTGPMDCERERVLLALCRQALAELWLDNMQEFRVLFDRIAELVRTID